MDTNEPRPFIAGPADELARDTSRLADGPVALASRLMALSRARNLLFGGDLFRSPAWDILLCLRLFEAGITERGLADQTRESPSLTARWVALLIERDLICHDILEGQAVIRLTIETRMTLDNILSAAF